MTVQTRCPSWCSEDRKDLDGKTFAFHAHQIITDCLKETRIEIIKEPQIPDPFIDVEVQGGNYWTAAEVVALISALVRAVWVLDPDYENPADHDRTGLWLATGKAIRRHMRATGLNQEDLARPLEMSQPDFSVISRGLGVRSFTLNELDAIAEMLGITLAELVQDIEVAR